MDIFSTVANRVYDILRKDWFYRDAIVSLEDDQLVVEDNFGEYARPGLGEGFESIDWQYTDVGTDTPTEFAIFESNETVDHAKGLRHFLNMDKYVQQLLNGDIDYFVVGTAVFADMLVTWDETQSSYVDEDGDLADDLTDWHGVTLTAYVSGASVQGDLS